MLSKQEYIERAAELYKLIEPKDLPSTKIKIMAEAIQKAVMMGYEEGHYDASNGVSNK